MTRYVIHNHMKKRTTDDSFNTRKPPADPKDWENWAEEMRARGLRPFGHPNAEERAARGERKRF